MKIIVNVRASVVKASTYADIKSKLPSDYSSSSVGNYSSTWRSTSRFSDNKVYVYNVRKENKKTKQIKFTSGEKIGRTKKSEIIRKKQWIANVYTFDRAFLETAGLVVKQNRTNFVISKR